MPKIVDHDQRRTEIVEAFLAVVGRDGPAAASSRAIAAELGVGAGALWHYFDSLDAVVAAACRRVLERTDARITSATEGRRGLAALDATLREILPLAKQTVDEAQVVVGFWGRLATDRQLAAGQSDALDMWGARLRRHLAEAVDDGDLVAGVPADCLAEVLLSIAVGQQVHAVLDGARTDPQHQLGLVRHCLTPWTRTYATKMQNGCPAGSA
ncbi:TetR/AcrR family transcriptional regulator [Paractinoplanes maris]|uniref:TetR/AcrR family transcriptional regulator n=1 Tax=Paractinoplanes maris TaxID=1734446 RepID=UPI00202294B5|nr:TetR/AcrR family transcriptional regulator [Actinoplanes maris]